MPVVAVIMAEAAVNAPPAPAIVRPALLAPPDQALLYRNYPAKALADRLDGAAMLHCRVTRAGLATDCQADEAQPAGFGFDAAALAIAPSLRLSPQMVDGKPTDNGRYDVRLRFSAPPEPPVFLKKASEENLQAAWPQAAFAKGIRGSAILVCNINVRGMMEQCEVASESPAGMGFGAAGLSLTPQFQVKPAIKNGVPVPAYDFKFRIIWEAPEGGGGTGSHLKENQATLIKIYPAAPWSSVPTVAEVARAFPTSAQAQKQGGRATLRCTISARGTMSLCEVGTVMPQGLGFDPAAQSLMKLFKTDVTLGDVKLAGSKVDIAVDFDPAILNAAAQADGFAITSPEAVATVTPAMLTAAFPAAARSAGVKSGKALIECSVAIDGRMKDCKTVSQAPDAMGFGDAALSLSQQVRLVAWSRTGRSLVGGKVRLPFLFVLP